MPTPRALTVAHETYSVVADRSGCDVLDADGYLDGTKRRIGYRPGLSTDRRREVLLHEALHAAVDASRGHGLDADQEEAVVDALTGPLLALLRRNPDFVAWLQGG